MPKLILVKHSMPEIVPDQPSQQWRLSAEGRRRVIQLANQLAAYHPARVISSPEPKAVETAQRLAARLGVPCHVHERLYEHRRSQVGYLPLEDFRQKVKELFTRPEEPVFGDETASEAHQRFSSALHKVQEQYPGQTLVVVSHGTVISLFSAFCCRLDAYGLWRRLDLPSYVVINTPDMTVEKIVDQVSAARAVRS